MVKLSDFLKYLNDSGIDITDQCIGKHEMSIEDIAKEYINQIDPVSSGQTVWVIKEEYPKIKLIECIVDHIRVSNYKRSFTVHRKNAYVITELLLKIVSVRKSFL